MNRHNLPFAWHAATDMSAIGWVMIAKQFKLSHKPGVAASIAEGDSIINATLLYFTLHVQGADTIHKYCNKYSLLFHHPTVHDMLDAMNGDRCLSDIR